MRLIAMALTQNYSSVDERDQHLRTLFSTEEEFADLAIIEPPAPGQTEPKVLVYFQNSSHLKPFNLPDEYFRELEKTFPLPVEAIIRKKFLIENLSLQDGMPLLRLSTAVTDTNGIVRILVAKVSTSSLMQLFSRSSLYKTYLVDAQGTVLVHPDTEVMFGRSNFSESPVVRTMASQKTVSGVMVMKPKKGGEKVIAAYSRLNLGGGLGVVAQIPESTAYLASRMLLEKSALFAILILGIGMAVAILFTGRMTSALRNLYQGTLRIAGGDFGTTIEVKSKDEVGSLTTAFNRMTKEIVRLMSETADKARMEKELETAQLVQKHFFPKEAFNSKEIQIAAFSTSASECGGDWWGRFRTKDNREVVLIGDAVGHGVGPALLTAMIFSMTNVVRDMIDDGVSPLLKSPDLLLTHFNRVIWGGLGGSMSTTLLVAMFDFEKQEVAISSAGHPFPILIPAEKNDVRLVQGERVRPFLTLTIPGNPLGLYDEVEYRVKKQELRKGDKVVFYTDGLIECASPDGKSFGMNGFKTSLVSHGRKPVIDAVECIKKDAFTHFASAPLNDDVTIVITEI